MCCVLLLLIIAIVFYLTCQKWRNKDVQSINQLRLWGHVSVKVHQNTTSFIKVYDVENVVYKIGATLSPHHRINQLWRHVAAYIRANITSGHGMLPDGTHPLPETTRLTLFPLVFFCGIHRKAMISQWVHQLLFCIMRFKIIVLWLPSHIPRHIKLTPLLINSITITQC